MQIKLSEVLLQAIREAELATSRYNNSSHMLDHAMIQIIRARGSHVATILSRLLKDWEMLAVRVKIEHETTTSHGSDFDTSKLIIERLRNQLQGKSEVINSAHVLSAMLEDRAFVTTRVFGGYGIDSQAINRWIDELPQDENYYSQMHMLLESNREVRPRDNSPNSFDAPIQRRSAPLRLEPAPRAKIATLEKYCIDLTAMAQNGGIDPVVGRDKEIERLVQILGRKKKNNPVLIGEAGVGKSALVEGLALRIVEGRVPMVLRGKRLFSLDLTAMVAGTKFRGDFEQRIKALIDELRDNKDVLIFIDELHTIVGAGSSQGSMDTANILKPALARGQMQCIGATTFDEYRQTIESDAALERRFQKIIVEPTTTDQTLEIVRRLAPNYQKHHNIVYSDAALEACVRLADRYITDRVFPDKALDLMDEAGARVSMLGGSETIDAEHIADVVALSTGIPLSRLSQNEQGRLAEIETSLKDVVLGQATAVAKVARAIQRNRTGLADPFRPIGVFMFVGPTGVGKTLLAKELAMLLFDCADSMIRIDMSEYSEKHNVSRLIGSPPGYVGYGEGGQLTERVRRQPYSVVLFDEIEKAHPDICNIMLQIFDDGHLTDGLGRKIDFRNTVIIMTSNVGSREWAHKRSPLGFTSSTSGEREQHSRQSLYRKALERTFAPEFINRIDDIVVFNALSADEIHGIVELELAKLSDRLTLLGYGFVVSDEAKKQLAQIGYHPQYGVRSLKRTILEHLEEPLSELIIAGRLNKGDTATADCVGSEIELEVA